MEFKLITCIVQRGKADKAVDAAMKAGAQGATIFYARGTGVRQKLGFIGRLIQAEKEVIIIAVREDQQENVFGALTDAAKLDRPGQGFAFLHTIEKAVGFITEDK
ncbi:MAG: P-II family nitrogen regulator [Elusimicrobia bacterium]|nr:P-II family nitrogen regulator [Elusimicrobiota bacterium]